MVLEHRPRELRVVIEDDGAGFDIEDGTVASPDGSNARQPLELSGMRERLALIGGPFRIASRPGAGKECFVQVPLEPHVPEPAA